jgi:S-adenosylmethionine:tRNA ribosyltransferase-isomerase
MNVSDFDYELPDELIARQPTPVRTDSRLLCLDGASGAISHHVFNQLPTFLEAGDLLVFNNTRVVPARLFGCKETGGKVEILFERSLGDGRFLAHVRASKSPKTGSRLILEQGDILRMLGRRQDLFELQTDGVEVFALLERSGHMPLPPYIDRMDESADRTRYQTVFACNPGAAAAPTAGLHFDQPLLDRLRDSGVQTAFMTLHVGAGTFQPVKVDRLEEHRMHSEWIDIPPELVAQVATTKQAGKRVVAVGTTSLRGLESASQSGTLQAMQGDTDIFIYPGYRLRTVDALITNFHLPRSTLLMLVSALAGTQQVLAAYREAVAQRYRFFSYGDAMLVTPTPDRTVHS